MRIQQHVLQHLGCHTITEVTCLQSGGLFCHSFSSPSNYLISGFPKGTFSLLPSAGMACIMINLKKILKACWVLPFYVGHPVVECQMCVTNFFLFLFVSLWDSSDSCYQRIRAESGGSEIIRCRAEKGKGFPMTSVMGASKERSDGGCGVELKERWKIWDLARLWTALMSDPTEVQDD